MNSPVFEIDFTGSARKQFLKLDKKTQIRIRNSLLRIRIRPFYFVKRIVGKNCYRLRVGDYRLLLDLKKRKLLILVLEVRHRRNVYKQL